MEFPKNYFLHKPRELCRARISCSRRFGQLSLNFRNLPDFFSDALFMYRQTHIAFRAQIERYAQHIASEVFPRNLTSCCCLLSKWHLNIKLLLYTQIRAIFCPLLASTSRYYYQSANSNVWSIANAITPLFLVFTSSDIFILVLMII